MPQGKTYRIEVGQGPSGLWYHRLVHIRNGQVIYSAETFDKQFNAERAARNFYINNKGRDGIYEYTPPPRIRQRK